MEYPKPNNESDVFNTVNYVIATNNGITVQIKQIEFYGDIWA